MVSAKVSGAFSRLSIPLLSDIPYVGKLFFQYNIFVYLGIDVYKRQAYSRPPEENP